MADVKTFMKLIKAMESSGGIDTKHPTMESGMHAGDSAIGKYGIMPNTAKEIANRRINEGIATPSDDVIKNIPNDAVNSLLKENPQLAKQYAEYMATKVLDKTKGDPELGMTAWHYGHNMPLDKIKEVAEKNPGYIEKVRQRIDENALSSQMPKLLDMLTKQPYKDTPASKKR